MHGPRTCNVGLIGRGIIASGSPAIHEAEARALDIALTYEIVDFDARGLHDALLGEVVRGLAAEGWTGCNVTHPFKQQVLALCDEISPEAKALGAVNTLSFRQGRIAGNNTDWTGFSWQIERQIGRVSGTAVAQVGAGGAGSATAFALGRLGISELALYDPSHERCEALAQRLRPIFPECRFLVCQSAADAITGRQGVVQSTPVGMAAHPGMPFDPELMDESQWLADIIYFPRETALLAAARAKGMRAENGVG
ncbi:MAG: shikimate dehydrogenase, partial [Betaproteobacteria bacterium]|nr:shikimate dehydrogenase [Betaproteobacteria bacterium]